MFRRNFNNFIFVLLHRKLELYKLYSCRQHKSIFCASHHGRGSSKWPGPDFPYYSSKAGAIEEQKRNTGRRGSSYTSDESSSRVEYESTTFFEVNTHFKYFSMDKPLCIFLFPL